MLQLAGDLIIFYKWPRGLATNEMMLIQTYVLPVSYVVNGKGCPPPLTLQMGL